MSSTQSDGEQHLQQHVDGSRDVDADASSSHDTSGNNNSENGSSLVSGMKGLSMTDNGGLIHGRYPPNMPDYTTNRVGTNGAKIISNNNTTTTRTTSSEANVGGATTTGGNKHHNPHPSQRAYRLNLERPFNIHNEQSPLEYGDYMKLWNECDYPYTVGPVEYMPPRHLGGNESVWRELMRYNSELQKGEMKRRGEMKLGSLDELHEDDDEEDGRRYDDEGNPITTTTNDNGKERGIDANGGAGGWRQLTPEELDSIQKLGEVDQVTGEFTFRMYDLSHVVERRSKLSTLMATVEEVGDAASSTLSSSSISAMHQLETVLSTESTGSEDEKLKNKTEEEMANDTARLFRRSELSLREKAEEEERIAKAKLEEEKLAKERSRHEALEQERQSRLSSDDNHPLSNSTNSSKRTSLKMSKRFSSKKLFRSLSSFGSKVITELNGTPSTSNSGSSVYAGCQNPKFQRKASSMQASAIEKARDLIDEESDEEDCRDGIVSLRMCVGLRD